MSILKQAGFSAAAIVSLLILIVALGFIGWRVYDSMQQKNNQSTSQTETPNEPQPQGNTIQIKELGVELTVPDPLKDLAYSVTERDDGLKIAYISTTSLAASDPGCSASGHAAPFGGLFKRKGQYPVQPTYENGVLVKQFAEYYLALQTPQSICSEDPKVEESISHLRKEFQQALESVKEIDQ